jgi:4-hydroxybenzoate polyprenyltransferase
LGKLMALPDNPMSAERNLRAVQVQLAVVAVLAALYAFYRAEALLWGAVGLGISFVALPAWGRLFARGWERLLGKINGTVLLAVLFFFILLPVALLYRLKRRDTLFLRRPEGTLWQERGGKISPGDLEHPW